MRLSAVKKQKMQVIKAPEDTSAVRGAKAAVFLAGSIEMGKAVDWQSEVADELKEFDGVVLLNPRRDSWDASWKQTIDNPKFYEQVKWEHDNLMIADIIFMYLHPDTKSPISLMELGLMAKAEKGEIIVVCPEGFWRKGNVEFICKEYGLVLCNSLDDGIEELKKLIG